jgi:hypothetical protein
MAKAMEVWQDSLAAMRREDQNRDQYLTQSLRPGDEFEQLFPGKGAPHLVD